MSGIELGQTMELNWNLYPLLMVEGAEVLRNMTRAVPESEDLNRDYIGIRNMLLEDNFVFIGALGRNKSGKGSMLMGFYRTLKQDEDLKAAAARKGIDEIKIITVPFVQAREVAKIQGIIPPESQLPHSDWKYGHARKISKFQWDMVNEIFSPHLTSREEITAYLREKRLAVAVLVEASTPLVRPLSFREKEKRPLRESSPVVVRGLQDLGNSVIYNLAVDPRFRSNCQLYFIVKGEDLRDDEESNDFRKNPNFSTGNEIKVVVTLDGKEVDLADLPEDKQQTYAMVLKKSMASSELVLQLDEALSSFEKDLYDKGVIYEPSDDGLYGFLSGSLRNGNFRRALNPKFRGQKTYDLDYLLKSWVFNKYPGIYSEILSL